MIGFVFIVLMLSALMLFEGFKASLLRSRMNANLHASLIAATVVGSIITIVTVMS